MEGEPGQVEVCLGETGRGDGVKRRLTKGRLEEQRWKPVERRKLAGRRRRSSGRMSDRVASCGSLYDSTSLLLQYCNNGEPLLHSTPSHNRFAVIS